MEWLFNLIEKMLYGLGVLVGSGIASAGEKVGTSLPATRPMDKIATARRMSRDQKELFDLYKKLLKYTDQAHETCAAVCGKAVNEALSPAPGDLNNPLVLAAGQL